MEKIDYKSLLISTLTTLLILIGATGAVYFWLGFDVSVGEVVNLGKIRFAEQGVEVCVGAAIVGSILRK